MQTTFSDFTQHLHQRGDTQRREPGDELEALTHDLATTNDITDLPIGVVHDWAHEASETGPGVVTRGGYPHCRH